MPFDVFPVTSPVIEALRCGKSLIERGWCQNFAHTNGKYCALGALGSYELRSVRQVLRRAGGFDVDDDIISWNDAPERTQDDVIALYDKAIELAIEDKLSNG